MAGVSIIAPPLTKIAGLRQIKSVQGETNFMTANLDGAPEYSERTGEELIASLKLMLGEGMIVDLNLIDAIPQEEFEKYQFAKCLIGAAIGNGFVAPIVSRERLSVCQMSN